MEKEKKLRAKQTAGAAPASGGGDKALAAAKRDAADREAKLKAKLDAAGAESESAKKALAAAKREAADNESGLKAKLDAAGAKSAGAKGKPGKRYCPLCQQCFSANNFVSQHLKNLHTPPPPTAPAVASDGQGGALLTWKVETCPPGAMPVGYQLESSTDNGASWEVLVEDTGSAEPRARLTSLATPQPVPTSANARATLELRLDGVLV